MSGEPFRGGAKLTDGAKWEKRSSEEPCFREGFGKRPAYAAARQKCVGERYDDCGGVERGIYAPSGTRIS
ncbi:hypothetical protein FIV00_12040 [Labrenzia sp. THAF82]|nr:hypothetical protein FIV00_12040 [Labrenzia sp. THAF82]